MNNEERIEAMNLISTLLENNDSLQHAIFELAREVKQLRKDFEDHNQYGDCCPHTGR